MMTDTLTGFSDISDIELEDIDGGIFPIIIGGVMITKGAALVLGGSALAFGSGITAGYFINR